MIRSLWTGASGMIGQQAQVDVIANNLANVNTHGFKKQRVEFEDLIYQTLRVAGTPATENTVVPVGVQMGHGTRVAATQRVFSQGSLQQTDVPTDMAIAGEGFFRVQMFDGSWAYTRNGTFKVDSDGRMVTSNGFWLLPDIIMPEGFLPETISVSRDGRVTVRVPDIDPNESIEVGRIELYRFPNPVGLMAVGDNLFRVSAASGEAIPGTPGFDGMGTIQNRFLEMSNVAVVQEMVNLIVAQRAYEFNSRTIQTSDSMLGTATALRR